MFVSRSLNSSELGHKPTEVEDVNQEIDLLKDVDALIIRPIGRGT